MQREYIDDNGDSIQDHFQEVRVNLQSVALAVEQLLNQSAEIMTSASFNLNLQTGSAKVTASYKRSMYIPKYRG